MKNTALPLAATLLVAAFAVATTATSLHTPAFAGSVPPATTSESVKPMSSPSGVRSPDRKRLKRIGAVMRSAPRAIELATPPASGGDAGTAIPSPAAIEQALAIPGNTDLRAWYESQQDFATPRTRMRGLPFGLWNDDQACVVRREGDTKFLRSGCTPATYRIQAAIDQAWADSFERYFGYPEHLLDALAYHPGDGSLAALEYAVTQSFAQHGIICTADRIMPDHQWLLDRSVPEIRHVADAIINAYWSNLKTPPTARQRIEALASYVQNAVPYRKVDDNRYDLIRDGKSRCGLRTPAETLLDGGDCDSKSLLLATLIRCVDTETPIALVYCMNGDSPHMVLAVGCDSFGDEQRIGVRGNQMALIETTSDWDIGHVSANIDIKDAEAQLLR